MIIAVFKFSKNPFCKFLKLIFYNFRINIFKIKERFN